MYALVIDDSSTMRRILSRIMRAHDFDVAEAADGAVALELLQQGTSLPDVCLVDWNMPNLDGYQFITAVRDNPAWRDITLMMVTTEGEPRNIMRALAAGAHEYVIKPFTEDAIVAKLTLLGLLESSDDGWFSPELPLDAAPYPTSEVPA